MKKIKAFLTSILSKFHFFSCPYDEGYVRVGADWIPVAEYRAKYLEKRPCDGARRCPNADDVTCQECETIIAQGREPITAEECAAQGGNK